jgi:hypothetical protein
MHLSLFVKHSITLVFVMALLLHSLHVLGLRPWFAVSDKTQYRSTQLQHLKGSFFHNNEEVKPSINSNIQNIIFDRMNKVTSTS